MKREPKPTALRPSKSTPHEIEQLAAISMQPLEVVPEWREIRKTFSIPEIISMVRSATKPKRGKGRPAKSETAGVVEAEARRLLGKGKFNQYQTSQTFWRSLPPEKRYSRYRSCVKNNWDKISARLQELKPRKS